MAEQCQFEEIAYLMIYGRLPTSDELKNYIHTLASLRELPGALKDILERIPATAHPMVNIYLVFLIIYFYLFIVFFINLNIGCCEDWLLSSWSKY